jgi:hypothetical protein
MGTSDRGLDLLCLSATMRHMAQTPGRTGPPVDIETVIVDALAGKMHSSERAGQPYFTVLTVMAGRRCILGMSSEAAHMLYWSLRKQLAPDSETVVRRALPPL